MDRALELFFEGREDKSVSLDVALALKGGRDDMSFPVILGSGEVDQLDRSVGNDGNDFLGDFFWAHKRLTGQLMEGKGPGQQSET